MKVDRKQLEHEIEEIIGNGVLDCEEIDVTSEKIMKTIEPLIRAVELLKAN